MKSKKKRPSKKKSGDIKAIKDYIKLLQTHEVKLNVHSLYMTDPSMGTRVGCRPCIMMC